MDFNELSVTMYMDDSDPYADEVKTDDRAEEDEDEEDDTEKEEEKPAGGESEAEE